jgi:hypothetical protein
MRYCLNRFEWVLILASRRRTQLANAYYNHYIKKETHAFSL